MSMLEVSSEEVLTTETITMDKVIVTNTVNMKGNTLNTGKEATGVKSLFVAITNLTHVYRS